MSKRFDYERASSILATSYFFPGTDEDLCEQWGISRATLWTWRKRLLKDPLLRHKLTQKKAALESHWQTEAQSFLKNSITKLSDLIQKADDPKDIHAVAGAVKVVGELQIAYQALQEDDAVNFDFQTSEVENQLD